MRISSSQLNTSGLREILNRQSELNNLQQRLATQKRFLTPADDPVAASIILNLETEISLNEQYNRNGDLAESSNTLEESVLTSVTNLGFRLKELMVSLGNGAYTSEEIGAIKNELSEKYKELIGLANTQNANGEYIFSGFLTRTQAFTTNATGNVVYNGDQGQRNLRISSGVEVAISDSGYSIFSDVLSGNGQIVTGANTANTGTAIIKPVTPSTIADNYEIVFTSLTTYDLVNTTTAATVASGTYTSGSTISYTAGVENINVLIESEPQTGDRFTIVPSRRQSIFTTLENTIAAIDLYNDTPQARAIFTSNVIPQDYALKNFTDNVNSVRSRIGSRLNALDSERETNLSLKLTQQITLSKLKDLDAVSAASELSRLTAVLEASQASFVRIQNLSLFNFLR